MNPLQALQGYGQSVWLAYIRRNLLPSGELTRLIDEDGAAVEQTRLAAVNPQNHL